MKNAKEAIQALLEKGFTLEEIKKIIPQEESTTKSFRAIVQYDRGLGDEFFNMPDVTGESITDAMQTATKEAQKHIESNKGLKRAIIKEIKLIP